eukprot:TRINITY_DN7728_c4_g1_i1.p1 TRINITY_DN7728_c4_g1~~TRINITY_DN7728_c4_g1_i1.p1  ORF type:complete len:272 (+),score=104.65 TRINITY_DN7728_c4_g1_i1:91-906(+)
MTDSQKAYLRKHDVPTILDNIVRQMLEEKPAKPFSYIVTQLKDIQASKGKPVEDNKEKAAIKGKGDTEEVIDLSKMSSEDQEKIIKIQAQYRGGKARTEVDALKKGQGEGASGKATEEAKPEINTDGWSTEDKDKLVKIQARYRGGKGRKEAEDKKASKAANAEGGSEEKEAEPKKEEEKPAAEDKPAEAEKPAEEKPAEGEAEKPSEEKKEEEGKKEETPEEKKAEESKPAEGEKEAAPAEEKKEEAPAETKEEEKPAEEPAKAEEAPKE